MSIINNLGGSAGQGYESIVTAIENNGLPSTTLTYVVPAGKIAKVWGFANGSTLPPVFSVSYYASSYITVWTPSAASEQFFPDITATDTPDAIYHTNLVFPEGVTLRTVSDVNWSTPATKKSRIIVGLA